MVPATVSCQYCGSSIDVRTYRKFVLCPYCGIRTPFEGFEYQDIDWRSSMYAHVKLWMDCPTCRSKNMYLGPSGKPGNARTVDIKFQGGKRIRGFFGSVMNAKHF